MATVAELAADLASCQAAIARAEAAQSVGSDGTSVSNGDLATLYKQRDSLRRQLEQAQAIAAGNGASKIFGRTRVTGLGSTYG